MSAEMQGTSLEPPASMAKGKKAINWKRPFKWALDNPVILKELRGRMRDKQAFILLTAYLGVIAILIVVVYGAAAESSSSWNTNLRQDAGKAIFGAVVLLELLLVSFIGPGLTAGAITSEREHQTFDVLRTTLLSARALILGKLGSAFTYLFLLILTALPIQSLAFLLGGVGVGEIVASSIMLVITAIFFCTLGIFFSSFMKRTLTATVSAYGTIVLSFLFIVIIFFLITFLENRYSVPNRSVTREHMLTLVVWFMISTNPFLAAIMSESILVDDQSLFYTNQSIFGGGSYFLISPWIIYVIVYILLTLLLIFLSIRRVKRPDR